MYIYTHMYIYIYTQTICHYCITFYSNRRTDTQDSAAEPGFSPDTGSPRGRGGNIGRLILVKMMKRTSVSCRNNPREFCRRIWMVVWMDGWLYVWMDG